MMRCATLRRTLATYPIASPFPGMTFGEASSSAPAATGAHKATKLSSGHVVVTADASHDACHIAVALPLGARHESGNTLGSSGIVAKLAGSSKNSLTGSAVVGVRAREAAGLQSLRSVASREHLIVAGSTHNGVSAAAARSIVGAALCLDIADESNSVEFARAKAQASECAAERDGQSWVTDLVAEASFAKPGLGNAAHLPANVVASRTARDVAEFYTRAGAGGGVITGVGIEHEALIAAVEEATAAGGFGVGAATAATKFLGGRENHVLSPSDGDANVAIAFQGPGARDEGLAAAALLSSILGGGSSFSEGGPGKGVNTYLFQEILCRMPWSRSAQAQHLAFSDTGLFVLTGASDAANAAELAAALASAAAHSSKGGFSDEDIARGKAMLISRILDTHDGEHLAESLAVDTLFGASKSLKDVVASVNAVTKAQLAEQAKKIFSGPATIASVSEGISLPSAAEISAMCK